MPTDSSTDAGLAAQPAAYITKLAYESIISFTRVQQAERGFTQPQFWLLRNLSAADISPDGRGMTLNELREAMSSYLCPEDDLAAEADVLVERGWLTRDTKDRLWLTDAGEAARLDLKAHAPTIRALIHDGIDEAEYLTAVKVLARLIRNTGGTLAY